jgi:hypothetical protein
MVERSKVVNSQAIESPGHPRTRTAKRTYVSVTKDGNGGFNELYIYIEWEQSSATGGFSSQPCLITAFTKLK